MESQILKDFRSIDFYMSKKKVLSLTINETEDDVLK